MGVYSEIAADLRDNVQDRSPTIQDAAELASRRADDRQQAEEEQAKALLSQMQQNADDSPSPSNLKADKKAEEDRKRQEHEQAEAKRKAEWEARQRAKEEAEQAAWENAVAMSDDEVMAASMKRVGDDSERLTRRNMKQCVTEYIQTLCLEDVAFARNVMHPRKNMVNCFRYINRKALEFAKQEMEDNDVMTMHKLMRYADAQYEIRIASTKTPEYIRYYSMANLLADYRDYLRMCKEMQYNVESSFILFPRNLKSAHDHVVEALDVKRTAEQEKAIADSFEEWQRLYQYKGKDLMVIPPHSSKELIDEGTALRHCVGRYVKRVAQRECVILFVRKVAEPDKSLCTVEVRDGQVVQARGFDNEDPPAKIKAFIERWKRQVLCAADKTAA